MPFAEDSYTGDGSTREFNISFAYIEESHIKVALDEANITAFTVDTSTSPKKVVLTALSGSATSTQETTGAPKTGVNVLVYRDTPLNNPVVDYTDGSTLIADDLDTSNKQWLYLLQEQDDEQAANIQHGLAGHDAKNDQIINVTDPTAAQHAATKNYVDNFVSQTANIADSAVTSAKIADGTIVTADLADSSVTSAKIVDGTIATGDIADSAVTTAKINNTAVTTAKLADLNVTSGKLAASSVLTDKISDGNVTTAKIADSNVTTAKIADSNVTTAKIADSNVTTAKIADSNVTGAKIASNTIDSSKLTGQTVVTNSEHSAATTNDTSFFTTSASDARYFRQDSSETIASGDTWSSGDGFVATTAAIDARVIDLVDDVGGFVPIANETSFPTANPDVNNGAGTIVSVALIGTTRTPSSGTVTIANGSGTNTVTITGCGSTVLSANYGLLVETTTTLHTYTFHRLVPRATEVTTVAGIAANVTTVATNVADVNNFADVYQISNGDPTTRADNSALQEGDLCYRSDLDVIRAYNGSAYQNITPDAATLADISVVADDLATFDDLGSITNALTAAQSGGALETCADNIADIRALADIEDGTTATDAISDLAAIASNVTTVAGISTDVTAVAGKATEIGRLGTADAVADMAILGTTDVVADMNLLATNDVVSDMNTLATSANVSNMDTCADDISNINTTAGSISNVNTVAGSISDVNRYASEYTIGTSQPSSPQEGFLWFDSNTGQKTLKFYNGSTFNAISAGIASLSDDTSPQLGGTLDANSNNISNVGTIDGANMTVDFGTL